MAVTNQTSDRGGGGGGGVGGRWGGDGGVPGARRRQSGRYTSRNGLL